MTKNKTKKIVITYLIVSAIIYVILYNTNKTAFWLRVATPPYP